MPALNSPPPQPIAGAAFALVSTGLPGSTGDQGAAPGRADAQPSIAILDERGAMRRSIDPSST